MATLRARHPASLFEPLMRLYRLDAETGATSRTESEPGDPPPEGIKFIFSPKIKCLVSTSVFPLTSIWLVGMLC